MISLLAKKFIKNREDVTSPAVRQAYGMLCGIVGIGFNVLLFALKLIAGTLSGSIAITADAFNNLSDAGASIVTLLGFKLAGQKPDPEHPFGHGRLEYISGLIVSMVILLMGIELAKSAVEKILHPEAVEFTLLTGGILLASILVKLYMYLYNRAVGKKIGSAAMEATAMDSLSDCAATAAVLAATLIGHFTSLQIDGWCGIVVAALVLWAGIQAARDTISPLLGQPPAPEFVQRIEEIVLSSPVVQGIHDLIVHDYGPGRVMISLHAEVPAHGDIMALHDEIEHGTIQGLIVRPMNLQLPDYLSLYADSKSGIHIYTTNRFLFGAYCCNIHIYEESLCRVFLDFIQSLPGSPMVYSKEETLHLLEQYIAETADLPESERDSK